MENLQGVWCFASKEHLTLTNKKHLSLIMVAVSSPRPNPASRSGAADGRAALADRGFASWRAPGSVRSATILQGASTPFPKVSEAPTPAKPSPVTQPPRPRPIKPSSDRAYWGDETGIYPLCYLAWGARDYSEEPIPPYACGGWQYILVQSGRFVPAAEAAAQTAAAGALLIVGPHRAFGWQAGSGRLLNCMWAGPATSEIRSLPSDTLVMIHTTEEAATEFVNIHSRCRKEITSLDSFSSSVLHDCQRLLEILILRTVHSGADPMESPARRTGLARNWMAEHLDSREPIARVCDYLGIAPATLHRDFVRQTGLAPAAYFHELKMKTSLELLRDGFTIKEAAATLGYRCFNDFSRAVHRYFGHPPSKLLHSSRK